ncbi:hypothetical protein [Thiomonas intermedia]|uniref:hypothetical protein n=1 Tax=Thiomonas intermedia TaxID=926 RepID=UPI0012ABDA4C|nr:hypothetical protein [Thiomonas intermedia]
MTTHSRPIRRVAFLLSGLSLAALLGSCGSHLSGTYGKESDGAQFTFKSGGKVDIELMGGMAAMEGSYTVEDGKVKVMFPQGVGQVFKLDGDCLNGGAMYGKLCKQ